MKTFLATVAEPIYKELGSELAHTAIVFPGKRAGLFFSKELIRLSEKPMWGPTYLSISELYERLTPWQCGDKIALVCELYQIYRQVTDSKETLDKFYNWGELLLSDFDDIDKHLVEAQDLFQNLEELKALEGLDYLDGEQRAAIATFFGNLHMETAQESPIKQQFLHLWDKLGIIYTRYKAQLAAKGVAYEGMISRYAVEHLNTEALPFRHYVFVGFNALNQVERKLFSYLRDAGVAYFFWDYDRHYQQHTHEAGRFIERNLHEFPQSLSADCFDNFRQPKEITIVGSPTESAQARYVDKWLTSKPVALLPETAVVLCNEALLPSVLHTIPPSVEHFNITMGFPLNDTPISSFVEALTTLHLKGYNRDRNHYQSDEVIHMLCHSYTQQLVPTVALNLAKQLQNQHCFYPTPAQLCKEEFLTLLFTPIENTSKALCERLRAVVKQIAIHQNAVQQTTADSNPLEPLMQEALFQVYTTLNRLLLLMDEDILTVQPTTFAQLLQNVLRTLRIPFHGEPADGLQVMGVLETRNLDFKHVALLSCNEGLMPRAGANASFIPYNLRKAFGMTVLEEKQAVYAYYFYRLLQRAEDITILYNNSMSKENSKEMSHFLLQLLVEDEHHQILRSRIINKYEVLPVKEIEIAKTPAMMQDLLARYERKFMSPSALNCYMECPLKFYFRYVLQLRVKDELTEDINAALFGTLFHTAAQNLYAGMEHRVVTAAWLEKLETEEHIIDNAVNKAFREAYFHIKDSDATPSYQGMPAIVRAVIKRFIKKLIKIDKAYAPFVIEEMEQNHATTYTVELAGESHALRVGGIIDRIDSKDGVMRVVDYKTGGSAKGIEDIESLFAKGEIHPSKEFQASLYADVMSDEKPQTAVSPALLFIKKVKPGDEMAIKVNKTSVIDFKIHKTEFKAQMQKLLDEIFDTTQCFEQDCNNESCKYCDFKRICKVNVESYY